MQQIRIIFLRAPLASPGCPTTGAGDRKTFPVSMHTGAWRPGMLAVPRLCRLEREGVIFIMQLLSSLAEWLKGLRRGAHRYQHQDDQDTAIPSEYPSGYPALAIAVTKQFFEQ